MGRRKRRRRGFDCRDLIRPPHDPTINEQLIAELPSSRDRLIENNMRIAFVAVNEALARWHWLEPATEWGNDFLSIGFEALTKAVDRFDRQYPAATFYAYCRKWIDGAIVRYYCAERDRPKETKLIDEEEQYNNATDPDNAEFYEDYEDSPRRGRVEWEPTDEDGRTRDRMTALKLDLRPACAQYPPTWRAYEMIELLAAGYTVRQIAERFDQPRSTVQDRKAVIQRDLEKLW